MDESIRQAKPQQDSNPEAAAHGFFKSAVSMCNTCTESGALADALVWAVNAEQIAGSFPSANPESASDVRRCYLSIAQAACERAQEMALISGNIWRDHGLVTDQLTTALERLSAAEPEQERAAFLLALGHASTMRAHIEPFVNAKPYRVTTAKDLDQLLESLHAIEERLDEVAQADDSARETAKLGKRLAVATTAVSNARFQLIRLFSQQLSDWEKAEVFCRRAFLYLTNGVLGAAPLASTGNARVDAALSGLPSACEALRRRSYTDSASRLKSVEDGLKRASTNSN